MVRKYIIQVMCALGCWGCMFAAGKIYDPKAAGIVAVALIMEAALMELMDQGGAKEKKDYCAECDGCIHCDGCADCDDCDCIKRLQEMQETLHSAEDDGK